MYKLLIVDDEQSVRYSFKKLFNSAKYKIAEASNSDEAIASFNKERPNLVILDIEMPGKDGIQVLKEIKELSPKTPVIIITAYMWEQIIVCGCLTEHLMLSMSFMKI